MIFAFLFIMILAGIADAIKDCIQFHFEVSKLRKLPVQFWDPRVSWKNKYKNGIVSDGPKFLGSTTIFVMFTDAWHLFKSIHGLSLLIGQVILLYKTQTIPLDAIFIFLFIGWVVYKQSFEHSYKYLKKA